MGIVEGVNKKKVGFRRGVGGEEEGSGEWLEEKKLGVWRRGGR